MRQEEIDIVIAWAKKEMTSAEAAERLNPPIRNTQNVYTKMGAFFRKLVEEGIIDL